MIPKQFDEITKTDIDALRANAVPEGRALEYKLVLPERTDDKKMEFLADVSSFANAAGGDIFYGIAEDQGVPTATDGLPGIDPDAESLRLDQIIRSGIEPRIPGVRIKAVQGFPQGPVLVVRIPQSWASPHIVKSDRGSRFYTRDSAGKHQMDVTEIRAAFLLSEAIPERIKRFRDHRLSRIIAGETPVPVHSGPKMVLHVIPVAGFAKPTAVDVVAVFQGRFHLRPMVAHGWDVRMNLDGCATFYSTSAESSCFGYSQLFRSGAIEALDSFLVSGEHKLIPSRSCEEHILRVFPSYLTLLQQLGVEPPAFAMLTFIGVKGFALAECENDFTDHLHHAIYHDVLSLPELLIEDYSQPADSLLKPIFDILWQSAGYSHCYNYNDAGQRIARR